MVCPDDNQIVQFFEGRLEPDEAATIEAHADRCASCRRLLAEVARVSVPDRPRSSSEAARRSSPPEEDDAELSSGYLLVGRYRILRLLGRGSMGDVFAAEDEHLGERIALKLLRRITDSEGHLPRLFHEVTLGRRISHPNVCRVHDVVVCGSLHFVTMALVEGKSLDALLAKGPLELSVAEAIVLQIVAGLDAAHAQGVVHRDLKPSNVMIGSGGHVTLMDLGLARDLFADASISGMFVGTPAYWAPEQARGERATVRSDIYALGVIAVELLTGERPRLGDAERSVRLAPRRLRAVLMRCLAPNPADRFTSIREVKDAWVRARKRRIPLWLPAAGLLFGGLSTLPIQSPGPGAIAAASPPAVSEVQALFPPTPRVVVAPPELVVTTAEPAKVAGLPERSMTRRVPPRPRSLASPRALSLPADRPVEEPKATEAAKAEEPANMDRHQSALNEVERRRVDKGLLLDDLPGARAATDRAKEAIIARRPGDAEAEISWLVHSVDACVVDQRFVQGKLDRLGRRSARLAEDGSAPVKAAFKRVHERYFARDYAGANRHLNEIEALLAEAQRR